MFGTISTLPTPTPLTTHTHHFQFFAPSIYSPMFFDTDLLSIVRRNGTFYLKGNLQCFLKNATLPEFKVHWLKNKAT